MYSSRQKLSQFFSLIAVSITLTFSCSEESIKSEEIQELVKHESISPNLNKPNKPTETNKPDSSDTSIQINNEANKEEYIVVFDNDIFSLNSIKKEKITKNVFQHKHWAIEDVYKFENKYLLFVNVSDTQKGKLVFLDNQYKITKEINVPTVSVLPKKYAILDNKLYATTISNMYQVGEESNLILEIDLKLETLKEHKVAVKQLFASQKGELLYIDFTNTLYKFNDLTKLNSENSSKLVQFGNEEMVEDVLIDKNDIVWATSIKYSGRTLIHIMHNIPVDYKYNLFHYDLNSKKLTQTTLEQKFWHFTSNFCYAQDIDKIYLSANYWDSKAERNRGKNFIFELSKNNSNQLELKEKYSLPITDVYYSYRRIIYNDGNSFILLGGKGSKLNERSLFDCKNSKLTKTFENLDYMKYITN